MPGHGMSRWDGDVHYYDYTPETLRREPGRDAFVVAEAFIYDTNKTERVAITVLASAQELNHIPRDAATPWRAVQSAATEALKRAL